MDGEVGGESIYVDYSDGKIRLWEIDKNGNMVKNTALRDTSESLGANIKRASWLIKDATLSGKLDIKAIGNFGDSVQSIMSTNQEGRNISLKPVIDKKDYSLILKEISLYDDSLLLIGKNAHNDGLVIKVDSQGNRIWEKTYDLGQLEFFTDGIPIDNNDNFLVIGRSVKPDGEMSINEPSFIWMLTCDGNGKTVSDKKFQGGLSPSSMPQVCKLDSGDFVAVYNKGTEATSTDLTIKGFSSNLEAIWEKSILKSEEGPPISFKITEVPEGGFVVANNINFGDLRLYEYDNVGNRLGSFSMDDVIRCINFSLAPTEGKVFVCLQTRSHNSDISKIKVIALELNQPG